MSEIAICVSEISKLYHIGATESYKTMRDTISRLATAPLRLLRGGKKKKGESFWALKDVSFDVRRGEVIGVIGPNGAGKSTLLKILSRITEPTSGFAEIHGRVGSLLEVGTGFHLELTGRENIFLNGAILGMRRAEIESKFDEMVAFAEVGKFIDTPVKHYSSGMYLRLAFSVAAHLEPEILLVDEVLAVGDMSFQKKCLRKMEDVASHGRTVLFVSHNLAAIRELCQSTVVLESGRLSFQGSVTEGLVHYNRALTKNESEALGNTGWRSVSVNGVQPGLAATVPGSKPFFVEAQLNLREEFKAGRLFCMVHNSLGEMVVHQRIDTEQLNDGVLRPGRYRVRVNLPALWLAPGVYTVHFKFLGTKPSGTDDRMVSERAMLDMDGDSYGIGRATLAPAVQWNLENEEAVAAVSPAA
jgi:lipopolysaccharide transport system ATP-binding protein